MPVNSLSTAYQAALPKWTRIRDCCAGRDAVMAAGFTYLPALPGLPAGYSAYQMRASFYNAAARTVEGLSGTVHQKSPVVTAPEPVTELLSDVVPTGTVPFEALALRVTQEAISVGRVGVLVDVPDGETPAPRPYASIYAAEAIYSWRTDRRGSEDVLTRVVLRETVEREDPKDTFVTETVERFRVCELVEGRYQQAVWEEIGEGVDRKWSVVSTSTPTRRGEELGFIPFLIVGPGGVSPEIQKPPMLDLVDVLLGLYRNSADHEHGLHLVALPTPWVAGLAGDGPLEIGPSFVWELEATGSAGMLEFSGAGLAAIREAMVEKKRQMASLGARLLEDSPGVAETLGAVALRHGPEHATLRTIAGAVELALTQIVRWLGWWVGFEATPAEVEASVELNKEFLQVRASPEEIKTAFLLWQGEGCSYETFWERVTKGGWAREGVTADEEMEAIRRGGGAAPALPPGRAPALPPGRPGAAAA